MLGLYRGAQRVALGNGEVLDHQSGRHRSVLVVLDEEAGKLLLNFDPRENRDYFRQMFHRGKKVAGDLRSKVSGKGEDTESAAAAA